MPGGVTQTLERKSFKVDAGPSLWNGMNTKPFNPLREILVIIGEGNSVQYAQYDEWIMHVPEENFEKVLQEFGGPNAVQKWTLLIFPKASTMV